MIKKKVQCPLGHYYNGDKYSECPVCSANPAPSTPVKQMTESMFSIQKEDQKTSVLPVGHTASTFQDASGQDVSEPIRPQSPVEEQVSNGVSHTSLTHSSLQEAVDAVTSHKDTEDVKTVAMWNAPVGSEPVVGWLICVKGEYFGQSFSLKAGNNSVGRAMNMDIHLAQEDSVSRNKHCVVTYEPNTQVFFVQQGESSGLTYLNGEMIMTPSKMKAKDRIKVGQAEFLLIPLCVDGFKWEDYLA